MGYNYRLSNLLAAVGRGQLAPPRRSASRPGARTRLYYRAALSDLPGLAFMPEAPDGARATQLADVHHHRPQRVRRDREDVRLALEAADIEARPVWKPMHLQPVFRDCEVIGGGVAQRLFELGICLPSGSSLASEERERIVAIVRALRQSA